MTAVRGWVPTSLFSLLLLASQPALARKNPASIAVKEGDDVGVLLVGLVPAPFDYQLVFQKEGSGGFGSRVYMIDVEREGATRPFNYEARTLAPGRYVLKYVMQQKGWIGCLEDNTILIDIKSGVINYLGFVDTRRTLTGIQRNAVARGELRSGGGSGGGIYHEGFEAPIVASREPADLEAARLFVQEHMKRTRAPTMLATIAPHSFRRPDDRNRLKRACD